MGPEQKSNRHKKSRRDEPSLTKVIRGDSGLRAALVSKFQVVYDHFFCQNMCPKNGILDLPKHLIQPPDSPYLAPMEFLNFLALKPNYVVNEFQDCINKYFVCCRTLVKNYEHRPYAVELLEHPFLEQVPENNYHVNMYSQIILFVLNIQFLALIGDKITDKRCRKSRTKGEVLRDEHFG